MQTFAEKIISFCCELDFGNPMPPGISVMNPFRTDPEIIPLISRFYRKFYNDSKERHMILGINPGRFGAGVTGIPFTDTIRLKEKCGLSVSGIKTYETSSVFIYEMIDEYGGPAKFYSDFFISAVSPLGFTAKGLNGRELNYNYYDDKELTELLMAFIVTSIEKQLSFGIIRDVCFCLGIGRNFKFLSKLNDDHHFFGRIEPLEHPRFIMQYRSKGKNNYIKMYVEKLGMR